MEWAKQFEAWWDALALKGDPYRRPYLVQEAFKAGYAHGRGEAVDDVNARLDALRDHLKHTEPRSDDRR